MKRVALVTGGARGIGLGIARALAREGLDLALNGIRGADEVTEVIDSLSAHGVDVFYCSADIGSADDRHRLIDSVIERFGHVHVVVNNAGITSPGRKDILEAEEAAFDRVMSTNLKGPFFLTQLAARQMIAQKEQGSEAPMCIINVSSVSAQVVSVHRGDYCLSKAALQMGTKLWAVRLAEHGIPVYELQPGIILSDMTSGVREKYDRLIADGLMLERRWGTPEDVGRAAAMLVRGDLPYATGQVLQIDGGMQIQDL